MEQSSTSTGYAILRANPQLQPPAPLAILVQNTGSTATTYLDENPVRETRNTYRVAAWRGSTGSGNSNFAFVDVPAVALADDWEALVALYNAADGGNWTDNTNWASTQPLTDWHGVATDSNGRVTRLSLSSNALSGEIPAELGDLTNLQELYLDSNTLSGAIPAELGGLTSLQYPEITFRTSLELF